VAELEPRSTRGDRYHGSVVSFTSLPLPLKAISFVQSWLTCLPGYLPSPVGQSHLGVLPQGTCPLSHPFHERYLFRRPALGEDHLHLQSLRAIPDLGFPKLPISHKTFANPPLNIENIDIPTMFHFSK